MLPTRTLRLSLAGALATCLSAAAPASAPLFFMPGHGGAAQFVVRGSGLTASFAPGAVTYRTREGIAQMEFVGASAAARMEPVGRLPGVANILEGTQDQWQTGLPVYSGMAYRELYPGIDLVYGGSGSQLKSQFVLAPGADPSRILIRYSGAGPLQLASDGSLIVPIGRREVREEAPVAWQEDHGRRVPAAVQFALFGDAVGFALGGYDRSAPLIIDPAVVYSTLLGGTGTNAAMALAVDSTGAAYIAGYTSSYNLPTANPEQNFNAGSNDVFVAKLNSSGNTLVYATYIGGGGDDRAYGIAVDSTGAAYVAGSTMSTNFPVRSPLQSRLAGGRNAFVLKLAPAGNSLVFSTYLGGGAEDVANAVALDSSGNIYLAGDTTSTNFPITSGAYQSANRGAQNTFVAKLNSSASALVYATYLGGSQTDHAGGIAVDASGTAYIAGSTWSTDFPVVNAHQGVLGGGQDAFVARLAANGGSLLFSTYLGGSGGTIGAPEAANGIALDSQGNAYVAGATSSSNFPVLNAYQSALNGWSDAFLSKFSSSGALVYSTYLGGSGLDVANGIAVDSAGDAYIAGYTTVMDLIGTNAVASASPGAYNAFVAVLNPAGSALSFYAYIVDTGSDTSTAIALDSSTNIYFAGWTLSTNFPVVNGIQSVNHGYSAFVAKLSVTSAVSVSVSPIAVSLSAGQSQQFTATVTNTTNTAVTWSISPAVGTIGSSGLYTAPSSVATQQTVTVTATSVADTTKSASATVTLSPSLTASDVALDQSASQSSTFSAANPSTAASKAVDGNTDGNYFDGSVSVTNDDPNAWWGVDLGGPASITTIVVWNRTDGSVTRLSDYWIFVSNTPFLSTDTPTTLQTRAGTWSNHQTSYPNPSTAVTVDASGRYVRVQLTGTNYLQLAEVQVFGVPLVSVGITPTSTVLTPGQSQQFTATVTNTSNTAVTWSISPAVGTVSTSGLYTAPPSIATQQTVTVTATSVASTTASASATVTLSPSLTASDVALDQSASQSSTYSTANPSTAASKAVDGNTDGNYFDGSVSVTNDDPNAWWEVDLGGPASITTIVVWNRTDGSMTRLSDYWIFVSNTPFLSTDTPTTLQTRAGTWSNHQTTYPNPSTTVTVNASGRYVRVQLTGTNYLQLAEVQVFGVL